MEATPDSQCFASGGDSSSLITFGKESDRQERKWQEV